MRGAHHNNCRPFLAEDNSLVGRCRTSGTPSRPLRRIVSSAGANSIRRIRLSERHSARVAELKTKKTSASVTAFLAGTADEQRRRDCKALVAMMQAAGAKPRMWGPSIVGFGDYHHEYGSGRSGDWFEAGFSPRKT
jgi:hypothetical protein